MAIYGEEGFLGRVEARSPEEVLRQARIAHSNRVASLAQVNNVVDKHTRQRRTSLVRLQFDKDRSPFSVLDATALAAGCVDAVGEGGLNELLTTVYGEESPAGPISQHGMASLGVASTNNKAWGSSGSSALCSPGATATGSTYSANGSSFGTRASDYGDREGRSTPDAEPDPDGRACTSPSRMCAGAGAGAMVRAPDAACLARPQVHRAVPTIAWGEPGGGGGGVSTSSGWTPDPIGTAPDQEPGDVLAQATAAAAPGSATAARIGYSSPCPSPPPVNPPLFRIPRASAPSGPLVPSRGGFAGNGEGPDSAGCLLFRPPISSGGGASVPSHSSPLPQLPPPSPKLQAAPYLGPSPPPSPRPAAAPHLTQQQGGKVPPPGQASAALLPSQVPPAAPPTARPSSQQSRYNDRSAPLPALMLPSINATPPLGLVIPPACPPSPSSPASRASPGSPSGAGTGTGAWRLAVPASSREHVRGLASQAGSNGAIPKASTPIAPSSHSASGLSELAGAARPASRRGSIMGALDDSLTVMRSGAGFSAPRRGPAGGNSGRHTPMLRPASRGAPGSPALGGSPAASPSMGPGIGLAPLSEGSASVSGVGLAAVGAGGLAGWKRTPLLVPQDGGEGRQDGEAAVPQQPAQDSQAGVSQGPAAGAARVLASPRVSTTLDPLEDGDEGSGAVSMLSAPLPAPLQLQFPNTQGTGCLESVNRRRFTSESSGQWAQPSPSATPMRSLHMGAAPDGISLVSNAPWQ